MKLSRATIALYLGVVFVSGGVLGWFGQRLYTVSVPSVATNKKLPSPEEFRKIYLSDMKSRLKLTDQQMQQLVVILDETRAQSDIIWQGFQKERAEKNLAIRQSQNERIRAMLTAEQKTEYELWLKERQEKRERDKQDRPKKGGRGGPGI
jgi:hypothetical protein